MRLQFIAASICLGTCFSYAGFAADPPSYGLSGDGEKRPASAPRTLYEEDGAATKEATAAADKAIRAVLDGMISALAAGDINRALQAFTPGAAYRIRPVFEAIVSSGPHSREEIGVIANGSVGSESAEYALVSDTAKGKHGFLVSLVRRQDGRWLIANM